MTEIKKNKISYHDYDIVLNKLYEKLKLKKNDFNAIYSIPRGGLPIGVHLSHHLELPLVLSIAEYLSKYINGKKLLVVDDLVDTGGTFENINNILNSSNTEFETATLYYKPHSTVKPDYYVYETLNWIVFPWEKFEEIPNRDMYKHLK